MDELREVEINQISINPHQPRRQFNQEELEGLAASIVAVGLLHPPLVRDVGGRYELISGERRFRASQLAGLTKIPVIVSVHDSAFSAQAALIENVQRVDLNPIEIAKSLRMLSQQFGLSQAQLAERIGKKRSTIANYLRLLGLPEKIQDSVAVGDISMGHAKAILYLDEGDQQFALFHAVLREQMTVRQTEQTALNMSSKVATQKIIPSENIPEGHLLHLASQLQQKLGTRVSIQGTDTRGSISIEYFSLDDLDRLLQLLGISSL